MAGEKTEQPTDKKLREARKKGQVSKSQDLTNAFLFLSAAGILAFMGASLYNELKAMLINAFDAQVFTHHPLPEVLMRAGDMLWKVVLLPMPLLVGMVVVSAVIGFAQTKALFAPEAIKFSPQKLNPAEGFKNIFLKAKTYIELLKNLVKFAAVFGIVYFNVKALLPVLLATPRLRPEQLPTLVGPLLSNLLLQFGVAFLAIGAADFFIQHKLHLKELMMSKDEVKREFKTDEGDPLIKGTRRELHQELLNESSMGEVPQADVVVVNPTHLAVALRYVEETMPAPRVIAKGQDQKAQEILKLARRHGIPIMRNVPLARGLIQVDLGSEIPEELYTAVAEVLNWVYTLRAAEGAEAL